MALASIAYDMFQQAGHRRILYRAIDHLAQEHRYGPVITHDDAYDPEAVKELVRQTLEAQLGQMEVQRWVFDTEAPVTTVHATKEQYAAAIRQAYREATKEELWRIAYKLYSRYQAGDFTAAQLRTAFNMTTQQFNTFATTTLIPAHDKWLDLQNAVGS